ncbi:MAG TPA: HAMP domain-containing sensor histidine kinase [Longimicrobium sp.]
MTVPTFYGPGEEGGISSPSLKAAVERVAAEWLEAGVDRGRSGDVLAELSALARALEDGGQALPAADGSRAVLRKRLLWPLRLAVTREWLGADPPPDAAELLSMLRVFEALRAELHVDPPGPAPLGITGPEGLELIVEVAHDLRSPLTSILFLAETLRRGQSGEVNDLQRRQLGLVYSAALGMVSLASDLVELAQGGDRLVDTTPSPFSVLEVIESVCDIVRPLAEEKKIALRVLPPPGDQRIGFSAALSRVLVNLVSNALKYTDEGFVEITTRAKGLATLEFSVRDSGPGINDDARRVLFEPFRRRPGGDRYGFSGTGLGLAICRRLVHAMGSELHYETAPSWGTRFYFDLQLPPAGL